MAKVPLDYIKIKNRPCFAQKKKRYTFKRKKPFEETLTQI